MDNLETQTHVDHIISIIEKYVELEVLDRANLKNDLWGKIKIDIEPRHEEFTVMSLKEDLRDCQKGRRDLQETLTEVKRGLLALVRECE